MNRFVKNIKIRYNITMSRRLKWKPVLSFFCILASLFFLIALFNPMLASIVVGFIITVLTAFAQLFTDHYNGLKNFWFNKILSETHTFFIWFFVAISLIVIAYFFNNYRLSFKIEKLENK